MCYLIKTLLWWCLFFKAFIEEECWAYFFLPFLSMIILSLLRNIIPHILKYQIPKHLLTSLYWWTMCWYSPGPWISTNNFLKLTKVWKIHCNARFTSRTSAADLLNLLKDTIWCTAPFKILFYSRNMCVSALRKLRWALNRGDVHFGQVRHWIW